MKVIISNLKLHIKEDFNPWTYGYFFIFISACIYYNYHVDFESSVLNSYYKKPICYFYYFLFYAVAYYGIAIPKLLSSGKKETLKKKRFWFKSLLIMSILAFDAAFHFHRTLTVGLDSGIRSFLVMLFNNTNSLITILIPIIVLKLIFDRRMKSLYGLTFKKHNFTPYFIMLLIMAPLITWPPFNPIFFTLIPHSNLGMLKK